MSYFVIVSAIAAFALALMFAASRPLPEETRPELDRNVEDLFPQHAQHFPKLRQSLASTDARYIREKLSANLEQAWQKERRRILQAYMAGIAADFVRLDRLARLTETISGAHSRSQERKRILLGLNFRLNYRIAAMRIAAGRLEMTRQLAWLTGAVASLSAIVEARIVESQSDRGAKEQSGNFSV
ncbi:MAG: hypothetical protein WB987_08200 [Candidatus Acidiferrales bacterium]